MPRMDSPRLAGQNVPHVIVGEYRYPYRCGPTSALPTGPAAIRTGCRCVLVSPALSGTRRGHGYDLAYALAYLFAYAASYDLAYAYIYASAYDHAYDLAYAYIYVSAYDLASAYIYSSVIVP